MKRQRHDAAQDWSPQRALAVRYRKAALRHRDMAHEFDTKADELEAEVRRIQKESAA